MVRAELSRAPSLALRVSMFGNADFSAECGIRGIRSSVMCADDRRRSIIHDVWSGSVIQRGHVMATIQGVIHGKTIQLETEPGLPDGQIVSVDIRPKGGNG